MTDGSLNFGINLDSGRLLKAVVATGFATACFLLTGKCHAVAPSSVEFVIQGKPRQGIPIMDFPDRLVVLSRDGQIHSLSSKKQESMRHVDAPYEPADAIEMRSRLQKEFGRDFEVVITNHFLVVQPSGRGNRWPQMFEQCHRAFVGYMSKRGVAIRRGRFPMVAVVMPDSAQMYRELRRMDVKLTGVAGVYEQDSNRVVTHDGGQLRFIASTVRHEAAHQSAYNYNVHSRVVYTPSWITEGIGQMFEPDAMVNGKPGLKSRDRVNRDSLSVIRQRYDGGHSQQFAQRVRDLVGSNVMFQNQKTVQDAYSISWAMMFYLAEREPKKFAKVLQSTNRRGTYQPYDRFARLNDFQSWVGTDVDTFSKNVAWFMKSL